MPCSGPLAIGSRSARDRLATADAASRAASAACRSGTSLVSYRESSPSATASRTAATDSGVSAARNQRGTPSPGSLEAKR